MRTRFQARWISKQRADAIRKTVYQQGAMLLDSFNGLIVIEQVGSQLGDGHVLTTSEADYELQPVWCLEPKTKLAEARRRLGLGIGVVAESLAS
jgi:hypothetical protein